MSLLSLGQVWATDYEVVYTLDGTITTGGNNNYAQDGDGLTQGSIDWSVTGNTTINPWRIGGRNLDDEDRLIYSKTAISDDIVKIEIEHGAITLTSVNSLTVEVATDDAFTDIISTLTPTCTANTTATIEHPSADDSWENCYYRFTYNVDAGGSNSYVQVKSIKFYKEKSASEPSLSADPVLVDFGTVDVGASVTDQTVEVTFANLTGYVTYSGLTDPFSASGAISATGDEITISADATNAGTFQQTLTIQSAADSKSVEVTVKMKVAAPTGTFELFTEGLVEGDYVICSGTTALKNELASNTNYIGYETVTVSENKITNPSDALIWHIAQSGEYWTLYNAAADNYAASTGAKNKGQVIADGTDAKALWTASGTSSYEFVNKANTAASVNSNLRYNNGYGFACYGTGTGSALTLYKLSNGKDAAGLAYDAADAQKLVKVGGTLVAPTLTNPNSLAVTYASNNTSIAEVNETTGAVTIKSAAGVAVITASTVGDATHNPGSASYTIFVAEQAGTESDPLSEANAKTLIDNGCTLTVHVNGLVLSQDDGNYTVTLTNGFKFYKAKDLGNVAFTSAYLGVGDEVTAVGQLTKYNTTYELAEGCYLTFYEAATTPLTPIANDVDHPYTVAQALEYAAAPTTYDLSDIVYVRGKVAIASTGLFSSKYLTYSISDDGTTTSVLKIYNGLGIGGADFTSKDDILVGEVVVVKGNLTQYNTELELAANNELVSKKPVATIAIDNMAMEYGDVATISATITPAAAASTVVYNIKAGSDDVITLAGDEITAKSVTGTATIVATIAGTDDYEGASIEFTVSVSEGDTRKTAVGPAEFTTTSGFLTPSDILYISHKGGASTAPGNYNSGIRLYQISGTNTYGGYVTLIAKKGCKIDEVEITTTSKYATTVGYYVDADEAAIQGSAGVAKSGTYNTATGLNADSVRILNLGTGSNGRLEIASITVYYTGDAAAVDHYELGGSYQTEFEIDDAFNHDGLSVYMAYDAGGTEKLDLTAGCTFSEPDMTAAGTPTVEISFGTTVITSYDITVAASTLLDPELSYDPTSVTLTQGDALSAPTFNNPHSVTITSYASDNEAVATVTDGGVIALAGGTGTANITASFDGNASYKAGSATYTIIVNAPAPVLTGTTYTKVTSTGDITDGEYLIVYETENVAFNGDLATLDAAHNTVDVVISGSEIAGTADIDAAVFTLDVANGTIQAHNGNYIGVTTYGNGLKQNAEVTTYPAHTFEIDGEGNAIISIYGDTWNSGGEGYMILNYNDGASDKRFRYYKAGSQKKIQLYKKEVVTPETVRTGLTAGNYYTVCYNKKMTNVTGATLWRFVGKDVNFAYIEEVSAPFPAGTPYILYAEAATVTAEVEGDATLTAGSNGAIHGTFSAMDQDALNAAATAAGHNLYLVIGNQLRQATGDALTVGNSLPANRAYVILDEITGGAPAPGKKFRSMPLQGQTATGVENLEGSEVPVKMLINGQLFILRGEKLYDAQGRLVK